MNIFHLLVVLALVCAVGALIRPSWPLVPVGLLLVCIALLLKSGNLF
jgi:hypothetical protein